MPNQTKQQIIIAYDGDCPFCKNYIAMLRLRDLDINLELIDLRQHNDWIIKLNNKSMNPNDGIYVKIDSAEYHGAQAMAVLSTITTSNHILNKILKWCFKNQKIGAVTYTTMKFGRIVTLKTLRISKL